VRGDALWSKELEWRIGTGNDPPDAQLHRFCRGGRKCGQSKSYNQRAAIENFHHRVPSRIFFEFDGTRHRKSMANMRMSLAEH
jgi:hypothetical protein